jgi:hypothetical protein
VLPELAPLDDGLTPVSSADLVAFRDAHMDTVRRYVAFRDEARATLRRVSAQRGDCMISGRPLIAGSTSVRADDDVHTELSPMVVAAARPPTTRGQPTVVRYRRRALGDADTKTLETAI